MTTSGRCGFGNIWLPLINSAVKLNFDWQQSLVGSFIVSKCKILPWVYQSSSENCDVSCMG